MSNVSVRHIAKIEKGVINPSFDILEKLITALAATTRALVNELIDSKLEHESNK